MSESTFESALSRRRLLQGAGAVVASVGVSPWLAEATAFGAESKVGGTIDFLSWQGYDSPKSLEPVAQGQRRQAQADLHRDPRRHPGQDPGAPRWQGLRHHHLLPGLQAALRPAQDPHAAGREEDPEHQGDAAVLQEQLPRLLGQERRAHRGADVLGRARPRLRLEGDAHGAELLRHPLHEEAEGRGHRRRRPGRRLHARRPHDEASTWRP